MSLHTGITEPIRVHTMSSETAKEHIEKMIYGHRLVASIRMSMYEKYDHPKLKEFAEQNLQAAAERRRNPPKAVERLPRDTVPRNCAACNKEFLPLNNFHKYCSRKCYHKWYGKQRYGGRK